MPVHDVNLTTFWPNNAPSLLSVMNPLNAQKLAGPGHVPSRYSHWEENFWHPKTSKAYVCAILTSLHTFGLVEIQTYCAYLYFASRLPTNSSRRPTRREFNPFHSWSLSMRSTKTSEACNEDAIPFTRKWFASTRKSSRNLHILSDHQVSFKQRDQLFEKIMMKRGSGRFRTHLYRYYSRLEMKSGFPTTLPYLRFSSSPILCSWQTAFPLPSEERPAARARDGLTMHVRLCACNISCKSTTSDHSHSSILNWSFTTQKLPRQIKMSPAAVYKTSGPNSKVEFVPDYPDQPRAPGQVGQ